MSCSDKNCQNTWHKPSCLIAMKWYANKWRYQVMLRGQKWPTPWSRPFALSQKTWTHHGPVDGDDRLLARLCGLRVPHPPRAPRAQRDVSRPKRQAYPDSNCTLGVSLLRWDSCALHPGTRTHAAESDRRAPAPTPTSGKAVCMVLSIKIHQNQGLRAECRL